LLEGGDYMVYIISIIVACTICVSLRYLENKRINDPPHYNPSNKSSDKSDIKSIQKKLANAGYPIKIDGVYGEKTAEAVKEFQKSRKTSANRMLLWCGTTEDLEEANPILADGEIVFDRSTNTVKLGDGKNAFTELDYIGATYKETSDTK
jgi:peptidoglycan hydrolase-like protein with peptidoglycan-binding domain